MRKPRHNAGMNTYRGITDARFVGLLHAGRMALFRQLMYERSGGVCALCGKPVSFEKMDLDHKYPRILDGSDAADNIQVTHEACNSRKCGKHPSLVNGACLYDPSVRAEDIVSIPEAAKYLDVKEITLYGAISRGKIRILTHIDGRKMISRADVLAYRPNRQAQARQRIQSAINKAESDEKMARWKREAADRAALRTPTAAAAAAETEEGRNEP